MGITLHGIVEALVEREPPGRTAWESFATIVFNKNHALVSALDGYTREPARKWLEPGKRYAEHELSWAAHEVVIDETGFDGWWVTADELETSLAFEPSYDVGYDWRATARAALAFMREFEKHYPKVRLLLYRS